MIITRLIKRIQQLDLVLVLVVQVKQHHFFANKIL
jgi:hypothetical protein